MLRFYALHSILFCSRHLSASDVRFNEHIRPIFSEYCIECHGPDANKREGELRLDVEESAKKLFGQAGPPEENDLYKRITSSDDDERMPPPKSGKHLSAVQIEKLRTWIADGGRYERSAVCRVRRQALHGPREYAEARVFFLRSEFQFWQSDQQNRQYRMERRQGDESPNFL